MAAGSSVLARAGDALASGVRGQLKTGNPATLITSETHKPVSLTGDEATQGVLADDRLNGTDFEALGHLTDPSHFEVDKIHTRSMFGYKNGKRLMVTYWCDVCYIRTYTPGKCWCCQKYTDLDLRESVADE